MACESRINNPNVTRRTSATTLLSLLIAAPLGCFALSMLSIPLPAVYTLAATSLLLSLISAASRNLSPVSARASDAASDQSVDKTEYECSIGKVSAMIMLTLVTGAISFAIESSDITVESLPRRLSTAAFFSASFNTLAHTVETVKGAIRACKIKAEQEGAELATVNTGPGARLIPSDEQPTGDPQTSSCCV